MQSHERQIAEEAVRWFEKLRSGDAEDAAQRGEFAQWLRHSPRNVHHFLFSTALDRALENMDSERRLRVDEMLAEARAGAVPLFEAAVGSRPSPGYEPSTKARSYTRQWVAGIAACLASATITVVWWHHTRGDQTYATEVGEQRTLQLQDGSVLQLNTASRVQVAFSEHVRDVQLEEGEALFKVAPLPARPFRVIVENSVIQVLGTQFNVYRKPEGIRVAVLEGKVAVKAHGTTVLTAGEEALITDDTVLRIAKPDIASAASWRQRRLVFRVTPLEEVIQEFNRYNRAPKIRLEGLDGGSRHYTGTFDADDPGSLALLLSQDPTLTVARSEEEIVIGRRAILER